MRARVVPKPLEPSQDDRPERAAHLLPTSPIKGEVPIQFRASVVPQSPAPTSPLMGEASGAWERSEQA